MKVAAIALLCVVMWQAVSKLTRPGRKLRRRIADLGLRMRNWSVARSRFAARIDKWVNTRAETPGRYREGAPVHIGYGTFRLLPGLLVNRACFDEYYLAAVLLPGKHALIFDRPARWWARRRGGGG